MPLGLHNQGDCINTLLIKYFDVIVYVGMIDLGFIEAFV